MSAVPRENLSRYAWLSIGAAVVTISLKLAAWAMTGSVGLLSDALESVVNLVAAAMALGALTVAARPADEAHEHGYDKAEYFSSGVEGTLILVAALAIAVAAADRLLHPAPIAQVGAGLAVSVVASVVNLVTAQILLRAGKKHHSIALEADAHHLMTDVWTSAGVLVGVGLVGVSGWERLDPIVALLVAANIVWAGVSLIRRSLVGLLDPALPPEERAELVAVLERYRASYGIQWHALRTRQAASRRFVSLHVLVPGAWTVQQGHDLVDSIERDLEAVFPNTHVTSHLEPLEDEVAYADVGLTRRS